MWKSNLRDSKADYTSVVLVKPLSHAIKNNNEDLTRNVYDYLSCWI